MSSLHRRLSKFLFKTATDELLTTRAGKQLRCKPRRKAVHCSWQLLTPQMERKRKCSNVLTHLASPIHEKPTRSLVLSNNNADDTQSRNMHKETCMSDVASCTGFSFLYTTFLQRLKHNCTGTGTSRVAYFWVKSNLTRPRAFSAEYLHTFAFSSIEIYVSVNNKKAQLTQRERATAVHVWSVTGVRSDINCEYSSLRVNVTVVARKG